MIAAIANPIMCVGFFSGVFVRVVFASPLFLYLGAFTNPAIFVTKAHAKLVTAVGSPVFATAAFANLVCLRDTRQQEGGRHQILSTSGE